MFPTKRSLHWFLNGWYVALICKDLRLWSNVACPYKTQNPSTKPIESKSFTTAMLCIGDTSRLFNFNFEIKVIGFSLCSGNYFYFYFLFKLNLSRCPIETFSLFFKGALPEIIIKTVEDVSVKSYLLDCDILVLFM